MFCKNCGKEVDDNASVCIYCGAALKDLNAPTPAAPARKVNGLAIAGFIVALLSLYLGVYFCIASIVGLVLSIVGMCLSKKYNSCNGLAIAGLVISIISLIIWLFVWILVGAAILGVLA